MGPGNYPVPIYIYTCAFCMIKFTHIHLLMLKIDLFHQVCCWSHRPSKPFAPYDFHSSCPQMEEFSWMQSVPFFMKSTYHIILYAWLSMKLPISGSDSTFSSLSSPHEFSKKQRLKGLPPTSTSTVLWSLPWVQVVDGVMHCISMPWRCRTGEDEALHGAAPRGLQFWLLTFSKTHLESSYESHPACKYIARLLLAGMLAWLGHRPSPPSTAQGCSPRQRRHNGSTLCISCCSAGGRPLRQRSPCLGTLDWTVNMFVCWFASATTFVRENFRVRWNLFYMGWFHMETHLCVIESWPSTVDLCCFHSCCRFLAACQERPMVTSFLRALGGTTQWLRALDVFRQLRREGTTRLESLLFG